MLLFRLVPTTSLIINKIFSIRGDRGKCPNAKDALYSTIEMHLPKPIVEVFPISKSILMIMLICNSFSFCVLPLAGSAKEIVAAERTIVKNNHFKNLPLQPIDFSDRQPRNAATYYLKAFDLLKYPEPKTLDKEIREIMQNGWLRENIEIKRLLKKNELSIQEFQKGIAISNCDFDFSRKQKYLFEKNFPGAAAWKLFSIILLKGRYHESQNDFESAVDSYLSTLIYAQHISQDNLAISKATALVIGVSSLEPLKQYLNKKNVEKRLCEKIKVHLDEYIKHHFAAKEIIEAQSDETKSMLKMVADTFMVKVTELFRHSPGIPVKAAIFRKEFIMMAYQDIDYYYGNYIRAAETNEKKDWEFAISEAENFHKAVQKEIENDHRGILLQCFLDNLDNLNPKCTKRIRMMFMSVIPNYKTIIDQYNSYLRKFGEVVSLAKARCG